MVGLTQLGATSCQFERAKRLESSFELARGVEGRAEVEAEAEEEEEFHDGFSDAFASDDEEEEEQELLEDEDEEEEAARGARQRDQLRQLLAKHHQLEHHHHHQQHQLSGAHFLLGPSSAACQMANGESGGQLAGKRSISVGQQLAVEGVGVAPMELGRQFQEAALLEQYRAAAAKVSIGLDWQASHWIGKPRIGLALSVWASRVSCVFL